MPAVKIIPYGMAWEQALRAGYTGRIELRPYLNWIKTLPCDNCGHPPGDERRPIDPSHGNFCRSQKGKSPDLWALPECRVCHEAYERRGNPEEEHRRARAALYLLRAFYEGKLIWAGSRQPRQRGTPGLGGVDIDEIHRVWPKK